MNLKQRSKEQEILDGNDLESYTLHRNLKELEWVNRFLGGHSVTLKGLAYFQCFTKRKIYILDIGCGGGDTLIAIWHWAKKRGFQVDLTGVDYKEEVISYARKRCRQYSDIKFICNDFKSKEIYDYGYDIGICSLFLHHLYDKNIKDMVRILNYSFKSGFIINDLERNKFAYWAISLLTNIMPVSAYVKNDAPLSVKKGFKKEEIKDLFEQEGIYDIDIKWKWAFRWLVVNK